MAETNGGAVSYLHCPHCNMLVEIPINYINCAIYRHAVIKQTGKQLDPHAPKEICDMLAKNGLIYGCGKPFMVVREDNKNIFLQKCDYV